MGWPLEKLETVVTFRGGGTPSKDRPDFWDGNIPWVSPKDMKVREIDSSIDRISEEAIRSSSTSIIPTGSVLIVVRSGILARTIPTAITRCALAINQDIKALCPSERINPYYLEYFLQSHEPALLELVSRGATVHRLTSDVLRTLRIPLPPLPEQERIVAILDEAFAAIATATANAELNLIHARELFESSLHQVFGVDRSYWDKSTVSEIADHCLGKMLDKQKNRGKLQPYLRNQNVRWFDFDLDDVLEMRFEDSEKERYTALPGDLLICEGGYPGRAAIWPGPDEIFFQKALHRVRFHKRAHTKWFLYFLFYLDASDEIRDYFTGTGIQHLTGKSLERVVVPLPPVDEIETLVSRFEEIQSEAEKLSVLFQKKLGLLSDLKQSLLHQAFTGALTADPKAAEGALAEAGV